MEAMSTDDSTGDQRETPSSTAAQVGSAVASLAEAWLRDTAYAAVGLLAFVTALCGFVAADGAAYAVLGLVAGLLGFAVPTTALAQKRPASRIWLALLVGAVVAGGGLAIVLAS
jgi:hypothetical protein